MTSKNSKTASTEATLNTASVTAVIRSNTMTSETLGTIVIARDAAPVVRCGRAIPGYRVVEVRAKSGAKEIGVTRRNGVDYAHVPPRRAAEFMAEIERAGRDQAKIDEAVGNLIYAARSHPYGPYGQ